jgi:hypothetical protein
LRQVMQEGSRRKKKIRNLISSTSLVLFYVDPFYPSNLGLLSPHHHCITPHAPPALRPLYFTSGGPVIVSYCVYIERSPSIPLLLYTIIWAEGCQKSAESGYMSPLDRTHRAEPNCHPKEYPTLPRCPHPFGSGDQPQSNEPRFQHKHPQ